MPGFDDSVLMSESLIMCESTFLRNTHERDHFLDCNVSPRLHFLSFFHSRQHYFQTPNDVSGRGHSIAFANGTFLAKLISFESLWVFSHPWLASVVSRGSFYQAEEEEVRKTYCSRKFSWLTQRFIPKFSHGVIITTIMTMLRR